MSDFTTFKGVSNIGDSLMMDMLTNNLVDFFNWAFLGIGAFFNITLPQSGVYGGQPNRLRCVSDPYYSGGQVWETYRNNWVWESGVEYAYQPIAISGIYLNGTFLPSNTTGKYNYSLDYPRGRVTFNNTTISPTSVVQMEFSFRYVNTYTDDSQWFKELTFNSLRVDDPNYFLNGSGVWNTLSQNRVQMPAIVVEGVPRRSYYGRQLGGGQFLYQDVLFHIFAETPYERNNLADILTYQYRKKIYLYDRNLITNSSAWPLDLNGSIVSGAMTYPSLINNYSTRSAYFYEMTAEDMTNTVPGLYTAVVRTTFEIECPDL